MVCGPSGRTQSRASLPAWSPDGTKVAYLNKDESGIKQIFIQLADDSDRDPVSITSQIAEVDAFAWSPDATMIAFRALVPGQDELEAIKAEPGMPDIKVARRIRYRQDGVGWRGDSFYHLFVLNIASKEVTQITNGEGDDGTPNWSPDGKQIAYITDQNIHAIVYFTDIDSAFVLKLIKLYVSNSRKKFS